MTEQTQATSSPPTSGDSGNRLLIIGGMAALAVVAVIVIVVIILIPRLLGADENAIAGAMPPNTVLLVELNALNLANDDARRVARAFEDILNESDVAIDPDEPASFLNQLDADLEDASGLTISEDILPWIGPNLGLGLLELNVEALDNGAVPQLIFAATIRDIDLADQFIEDLIKAIEGQSPNRVSDREYNGVPTFEIDSDFEDERLAFARSDEIYFFAANLDILEEAIDAQHGENLGEVDAYRDTVANLPGERALTVYFNGEALEDLAKAAEGSGEIDGFDAAMVEELGLIGAGLSAMTTPEGIRLDSVSNYADFSEEQQAMLDAQTDDIKTAEFLPESTYVYLVGQRLDLVWQRLLNALNSAGVSEADLDEAMDLFDDTFGFNPSQDLMPLLDGEYSLALIDSRDGIFAEQFNTDIGAILMLGSSQAEEIASIVEEFSKSLQEQGLMVNDSGNDDVSIYEVEDLSGTRLAAYGISQDYLLLGTDGGSLESLFASKATLANSEQFKRAWDAFPRGTIPVMYIDLDGLFAALADLDPEIENAVDVNPVYAFAMGTNSGENYTQTTMILFVAGE